MADNPEQPPKATPPLPSSGMTGRVKVPTTKLPPVQGAGGGKVVVMLSSVAKAPPVSTQQLPAVGGVAPPKIVPSGQTAPLPPKQVTPAITPVPTLPRLTSTTYVKLPPKTGDLPILTPKPVVPAPAPVPEAKAPEAKPLPPPLLPPKSAEPVKVAPALQPPKPGEPAKAAPPLLPPRPVDAAKAAMRKTSPIILNQPGAPPHPKGEMKKSNRISIHAPAPQAPSPDESIFADLPESTPAPVKDEGWKRLETGELPAAKGDLSNVFERSQRLLPQPTPVPVPKIVPPQPLVGKEKPPVAPPLTPPAAVTAKGEPVLNPQPTPLPVAAPVAPPAPAPAPIVVAPPLVDKPHEEPVTRLPLPHLPAAAPEPVVETPAPAPALLVEPPMQKKAVDEPAPAPPAAPAAAARPASLPPPLPPAKPKENLKNTGRILLSSTSKLTPPVAPESKPALRPAVLPKRATQRIALSELPGAAPIAAAKDAPAPATPKVEDAALKGGPPPLAAAPKIEAPAPTPEPAAKSPAATPSAVTTAEVAATGAALATTAVATEAFTKKPRTDLPLTRVERAKTRRRRGIIAFWLLVPLVAAALFFGIRNFGRDTRMEGQVIPPDGMTLCDEVWIVSDFRSLAAGVADDLAKERVPLQQEIQERQDHVQRVQADIASREERIRFLNEGIQAAKDEITAVVKKSRDETQAIWDGEGAEIDQDYEAKIDALKHTIADRAASLKLPYTPDPQYPSPEVWANAYRLALYQTPPGVDGVKEHQWIGDQMKQWRDFEKSLDDRKEALREKAAQLKLEPAPKIADLNAKIDDLGQRVQGTEAEEEPLKAELQQAQGDLAEAQAAEATLDEKYYGQLDALPSENISYHIPVRPNGRFTWVPDNAFPAGEERHIYWIFARAIRADGRQYWSLQQFPMERDKRTETMIEPGSFVSTKAILRPNLSPDEIEQ
jgi:peptidoglycan hydrolase CwlO-like protein